MTSDLNIRWLLYQIFELFRAICRIFNAILLPSLGCSAADFRYDLGHSTSTILSAAPQFVHGWRRYLPIVQVAHWLLLLLSMLLNATLLLSRTGPILHTLHLVASVIIAALFHFNDCLLLCNLLARCHERLRAGADRASRLQIVLTRNIGETVELVCLRSARSRGGLLVLLLGSYLLKWLDR